MVRKIVLALVVCAILVIPISAQSLISVWNDSFAGYLQTSASLLNGIFIISGHGNVTWIIEGIEWMRLNRDGELGLADHGPIVTDAKLSIHSNHDNALSVHVGDHSYSTMKMFNDLYNPVRAAAEFDILNSGKLQFGTINDADVEIINNTNVHLKLKADDSCIWIGGALHKLTITAGIITDGGSC